jgi:predicted RNase H-like nuclease
MLDGTLTGPDRWRTVQRCCTDYDRHVRVVGIDLAWGTKAQTGLAVLDDAGHLLDVTAASTDDDIVLWMNTYAPGACVVAIDAPIIVTNPTGARDCERQVTQHFGRHHAGTHPTNTTNGLFSGGATRALRLATRLGLDVNPHSSRSRRALEVFPHSALVALFELPYILRYKPKRGRTLTLLQAEATQLLDHLETLHDASPPLRLTANARWQAICSTVHNATTKAGLRRVEDRIDAVVCAYVALLATCSPERLHIFGDVTSGYIATPVTTEIARQLVTATSSSEAIAQASPAAANAAEQIHGQRQAQH